MIERLISLFFLLSMPLSAAQPTLAKIQYGPEARQWLNIYQASSDQPTPVYLWAHHRGANPNNVWGFANDCKAAGITVISWASHTDAKSLPPADRRKAAYEMMEDSVAVFEWVKANAERYKWDADNIIIGGRSRGSGISWDMANSGDPAIKGIYMQNALPADFWKGDWDPRTSINRDSPPLYLTYRERPGTKDNHKPELGMRLIARYEELGIGARTTLVHSLKNTGKDEYTDLVAFIRSVVD